MRYFLAYIAAVYLSLGILGAQTTYIYEVKWSVPEKGGGDMPSSLVVVNANGIDDISGLPVMVNKFDLPRGTAKNDISVKANVNLTQPASEEETLIIKSSNYSGGSDIVRDYYISYVDEKPVLNVEIIPLVKKGQSDFAKVLKYSLSFDILKKRKAVKASGSVEYAANSVLSSGKWVKIRTGDDGIYRIPYSKLKSWGFNGPSKVRIFGNGGIMLPKANSDSRFDDLRENGTWHYGNAVYFYAKGTVEWRYDDENGMWMHQLNDFGDYSYYFLTEDAGEGKDIETRDYSDLTPNVDVDKYDAYDFHEEELKNLLKSGRTWYGEWFSYYGKQSEVFDFNFRHLSVEDTVKLYTSVIARANVTSYFEMSVNGESMPAQTLPINPISFSDYTGYYVHEGKGVAYFKSNSDNVSVEVKYSLPSNTSQGWLDYLCLNARCHLIMDGNLLLFRDTKSVGNGNVARFHISNTDPGVTVWDVTDFTRPVNIVGVHKGNAFSFMAPADTLKEYVAFVPGNNFPEPDYVEDVENQNLHAVSNVDYVIVAYKDYEAEAERLAELHQSVDGLSCYVVTNEKLYNEFSSGKPDIAAIRDFMRMLYKKAATQDQKPKYLLLFGDGSYDNRTYDDKNTNRILTYQSVNSIHHAYSYVSDDFFGFLDDDEGGNIRRDMLDIGIGRFPVNTVDEAKDAVNKVKEYLTNQYQGKWKTQLTFLGDDGDNNIHMRDADRLARKVSVSHPEFDINKIYFDSYQKITTSTGKAFPEVNELIDKTVLEGTLVFNYTGHGGENGLAHERVLTIPMIEAWTNLDRLPLFVTATCEFSRFDDYNHTSAGELVFLNNVGGGIGLFTTTRLVYSSLNFIINNNLYNHIFEKDENGNKLKLGDIMKKTKNASGSSINILNFTLLSDPAIPLAYPGKYVETLKVNDKPVDEYVDTIKALSKAKIEGEIVAGDMAPVTDFNGIMDIVMYDKPSTVMTMGNDGATPFEYEMFQNKIFTGQVSVTDGKYLSEFMVSKDIRYNIADARVSYYASDDNGGEAFGANNDIPVGGVSEDPPFDEQGPEIVLYLNKSTFVSGGSTGTRPLLYAQLYDENGINTTGIGIGHDLTLVIDDDKSRTMVMNGYFQAEPNSYQKGMVVFQLPEQTPGPHKLSFKAWDNLNNSSTAEIGFNVDDKGELNVEQVSFFPNPVGYSGSAQLYFTHDEPNSSVNIEMSTYTISGQLLNKENIKTVSQGSSIQPVSWYPVNSDGVRLGPGIYVVRFNVLTQTGKSTVFSKKILVTK